MAKAFFLVKVGVRSRGAQANLVLPKALSEVKHQFLAVRDGGKEALVQVDAPKITLDKLATHEACKKVTAAQKTKLRGDIRPKVKKKFRKKKSGRGEGGEAIEEIELDKTGKPVAESRQTVRVGYRLIDVPVVE